MLQTSAVPGQQSISADCCRPKVEVCNQKAEVDEGADEGAGDLPTDFLMTYSAFSSQRSHIFNELQLKALLSRQRSGN